MRIHIRFYGTWFIVLSRTFYYCIQQGSSNSLEYHLLQERGTFLYIHIQDVIINAQ